MHCYITMKYIFISAVIDKLTKGKSRILSLSISIVLLILPLLNSKGLANIVIGKSITFVDFLTLIVFIYFAMNLGFALLNKGGKETNAQVSEAPKFTTGNTILEKRNYTRVKSNPKEVISSVIVTKGENKVKGERQEYFQNEKNEFEKEYKGAFDNTINADITDVKEIEAWEETPLAETSTIFFNHYRTRKYF